MVLTGGQPHGDNGAAWGSLAISPLTGLASETNFVITSSGWAQEDLPLSFQFSYVFAGDNASAPVALGDFEILPPRWIPLS